MSEGLRIVYGIPGERGGANQAVSALPRLHLFACAARRNIQDRPSSSSHPAPVFLGKFGAACPVYFQLFDRLRGKAFPLVEKNYVTQIRLPTSTSVHPVPNIARQPRTVRLLTRRCDSNHSPSEAGSVRIQFKFMTLRSKLAAVALAITLLVLPATALASCWLHTPTIGIHATNCQMMSKHLGLASIERVPVRGSCCEMSSGKPVPASVARAPNGTADGVTPTCGVSSVDVPPIKAEAAPTKPPVRASGPALQAVLCVFLI
jgi:hypothetical protein